jgi:adenine-specific DNA-methyltransferase
LFDKLYFDYAKPSTLIKGLLQLYTKNDHVLDFFSGSATTAHAVMQLNAEDGGKRKFILVQLPEKTDAKSEAYKAGYKTICEIGKERIRRAGKKIQEEHPLTTQQLDVGFRVLKIDSSSINDVSQPVNELSQAEMNFELERIKADRSSEDLLFQVLLQTQIPLSEKIKREMICGNEVFTVGNVMVACLDKQAKLTEAFFTALAERQPTMAFFRDDTFVDDSARTNLEQIFKQFSKDTKIKVL